MIVDVDIGNTRAKYRVNEGGSGVVRSCSHHDLKPVLQSLISGADGCLMRVASVAADELTSTMECEFAVQPNLRFVRVRSVRQCAGVTNSYMYPGHLGVDRWLAMIAAYNCFRAPCIVIDVGSAATLDIVDADGVHQGGWICPGLSLLRSSLLQGTAGVRFTPPDQIDLALGRSTAGAVYNGTLAMMVGWLNISVTSLLEKCGNANIVLSGGDAGELRSHLGFAFTNWPDVVLDGLALVPLDQ